MSECTEFLVACRLVEVNWRNDAQGKVYDAAQNEIIDGVGQLVNDPRDPPAAAVSLIAPRSVGFSRRCRSRDQGLGSATYRFYGTRVRT